MKLRVWMEGAAEAEKEGKAPLERIYISANMNSRPNLTQALKLLTFVVGDPIRSPRLLVSAPAKFQSAKSH